MKKISKLLSLLFLASFIFTGCDDTPTEAPTASLNLIQEVYEGETVSLDASSSVDADGFNITYQWTAPSEITLSSTTDAKVTFVAPEVIENTELEFSLSINNGEFTTDTSVTVTILQSDIAYVFNYGKYGSGLSSIDRYNLETKQYLNKYYQLQNSELDLQLTSNIQFATKHNNNIYLMANSSDGIIVINDQLEQSIDAIAEDIVKPRYAVANGDYLYISCWGGQVWKDDTKSYIAKFNMSTNTVDDKIALPGGPEGLEIVNGNLYAALNYRDSVAVISLEDHQSISYIEMPNTSSYLIKDESDNLYISICSYSDGETGLGYINTTNNTLEDVYTLTGLSTNYCSIMSANSDFSKIYTLAAEYDAKGKATTSVQVFDAENKTYTSLASNLSGVNGVAVNPLNDNEIFVFGGGSVTEGGSFAVYNAEGTLLDTKSAGISPYWALFLNK